MKKSITLVVLTMLLSSCYTRIADLTVVSNRNVQNMESYHLIERNVSGSEKIKKNDALEIALDEAVESVEGEIMMNAKIYIRKDGRKIKIVGDVWGFTSDTLNRKP